MKPWEETWVTVETVTNYGKREILYVLNPDGTKEPFGGDERMQLAKCAPAMARLLVELCFGDKDLEEVIGSAQDILKEAGAGEVIRAATTKAGVIP